MSLRRGAARCAGRARAGLLSLALVATAGAGAARAEMPVFCSTGVGTGGESVLSCRRADGRASFSTVPEGYHLHVTDLVATRNNAATSGTFAVLIGRDDGDDFPGNPNVDLTGSALEVSHLRTKTPRIVLEEGESLAAANFPSSDFPVDVRASGFLARAVVVPEPGAASLGLAALASLGFLARRRAGYRPRGRC